MYNCWKQYCINLKTEIKHLRKQASFYEKIVDEISASTIGYNEITSIIGPILTLNAAPLKSLKLLAENNHYRDLIILSRPFLECIINVGFICYEKP